MSKELATMLQHLGVAPYEVAKKIVHDIGKEEIIRITEKMLDGVSEPYKSIWRFTYGIGVNPLQISDIAKILNPQLSRSTVCVRKARARNILRHRERIRILTDAVAARSDTSRK